jgi:hypothetical protein
LSDAEITMMEAQAEAARRRGDPPPPSPTEPGLKANIDLGAIVTQAIATTQTMSDKMTQLISDQTRGEIGALRAQFKEALDKWERPNANQSPLEVYREVKQLLDEAAKQVQGSLGLPDTGSGAASLPALLQLKKLDLDAQERRMEFDRTQADATRQYADTREERLRRWEVEDRRWEATFGQEKQKYADDRRTREGAMNNMSDLLKAVTGGIDDEMEGGAAAATTSAAPAIRAIRVDGYKCDACQAPLQWDGKPASEAVCTNEECGARFVMEEATT